MNEDEQICTFFLDEQIFGVEVRYVQEVLNYQEMTQVPLASQSVSGLINLRGQIVTAVDLRRRFGLPDRDSEMRPMNLIVRDGGGATSFLVDRIGEVREVTASDFERTPGTLHGVARDLVRGAYKTDDTLILMLALDRAVVVNEP